ncbi:MAG: hypothetical protein ABI690_29710 [Chloroflexota bacterium]
MANEEATNILISKGYSLSLMTDGGPIEYIFAKSETICNLMLAASYRTGTVGAVEIRGKCLRLGDLFLFWGKPDYVGLGIKYNDLPGMGYYNAYQLNPFPAQPKVISPYTFFQMIQWFPHYSEIPNSKFLQWRGFVPVWRFCQLEFSLSDCQEGRIQSLVTLPPPPQLPQSSTVAPLPIHVWPIITPTP